LRVYCRLFIAILGYWTFVSAPVLADTYHVDGDNVTGHEDGSAGSPFAEISAAIAQAANGDVILVAAGTYREDIEIVDKDLSLQGGYLGADTQAYGSGAAGDFTTRDPAANVTRIEGTGAATSVVSLVNAGITTIDGFAISGGHASGEGRFGDGGAVYCERGKPTISRCVVERNEAKVQGGGIHATGGAQAVIVDNLVRDNRAETGAITADSDSTTIKRNVVRDNVATGDRCGGICVSGANVEVIGNLVEGNEVGRDLGYGSGGGILIYGQETSAHLARDVVRRNFAASAGSGIAVQDGAEAVIENELIDANKCPSDGGAGLYVDGADWLPGNVGSKVTLRQVTVANHPCNLEQGDAVYAQYHSTVDIRNSIFAGHREEFFADETSTLTIGFSRTDQSVGGTGNITDDCLFAASSGDFHLQSTKGRWDRDASGGQGAWVQDSRHSPCIDAGDTTLPFEQESDPNGGRANLGVFGNTAEASLANVGGPAPDAGLSADAQLHQGAYWPASGGDAAPGAADADVTVTGGDGGVFGDVGASRRAAGVLTGGCTMRSSTSQAGAPTLLVILLGLYLRRQFAWYSARSRHDRWRN